MIAQRIEKAKKSRRIDDNFRKKNGYSWDYVVVLKVYQDSEALTDLQRTYSAKYILESLTNANLSIRPFYSYKVLMIFSRIMY